MSSRFAFALMLLAFGSAPPHTWAQPLPTDLRVLVLDIEQAGDIGDDDAQRRRAERLTRWAAELKRRLTEAKVVQVVDDTPARERIEREKASHALHACNGCERDLARAVAADAVLVAWLFRMSQLVVTMHFELRDAATGRLLMKRALDFRNDADASWSRVVDFLIRDMREGRLWNGAP